MAAEATFLENIEIRGAVSQWYNAMQTPEALMFLAKLNCEFNARRKTLLTNRIKEQEPLDKGVLPKFFLSLF
jgi:malate synthase